MTKKKSLAHHKRGGAGGPRKIAHMHDEARNPEDSRENEVLEVGQEVPKTEPNSPGKLIDVSEKDAKGSLPRGLAQEAKQDQYEKPAEEHQESKEKKNSTEEPKEEIELKETTSESSSSDLLHSIHISPSEPVDDRVCKGNV